MSTPDEGEFFDLEERGPVRAPAPNNASRQLEDGVLPHFYQREVWDRRESEEKDRPVYVTKDYIEILVPATGEKAGGPVNDKHRHRFPRHWQAYQDGRELKIEGTPITEWQAINRAQAAEIKHLKIYSVEQLAECDDRLCQKIGGGYALREKARKTLSNSNQLAELKKQNADLIARLEKLETLSTPAAPKRTRRTPAQMAEAKANDDTNNGPGGSGSDGTGSTD